jgi:hypothetical protein
MNNYVARVISVDATKVAVLIDDICRKRVYRIETEDECEEDDIEIDFIGEVRELTAHFDYEVQDNLGVRLTNVNKAAVIKFMNELIGREFLYFSDHEAECGFDDLLGTRITDCMTEVEYRAIRLNEGNYHDDGAISISTNDPEAEAKLAAHASMVTVERVGKAIMMGDWITAASDPD